MIRQGLLECTNVLLNLRYPSADPKPLLGGPERYYLAVLELRRRFDD